MPDAGAVTVHVQQGLAEVFKRSDKWSSFSHFVDDLPALPQRFSSNGITYNAIYKGDGNYAEIGHTEWANHLLRRRGDHTCHGEL